MNKATHGYIDNIEKETLSNDNFRKVLFTGKMQLVLMSLKPGEDIGEEIHAGHDQFFRIDSGSGKALIGDKEFDISDGDAVVIPDGVNHNIINTSKTEDLKLYTIYAPSEHADGTVHATKAEAIGSDLVTN